MVSTTNNIILSTGNNNSSQEKQLDKPNRISNLITEHKVFVTLGTTLATATAAAFTAAVYQMVPMTLPIILGGSLAVASIVYLISCYVSSRREKLEIQQTTQETTQVIEETLKTAAESKHIPKPEAKKELSTEAEKEEALKKLNETFEDIVQAIKANLLTDDAERNEKIANYFESFKVVLDPPLQKQKREEYIKIINATLVQQELRKRRLVTARIDRECEILSWLGIQKDQLALYGDKELMYRLALHFFQNDQTELDFAMPPRSVIVEKIKERALKVRLETVEITGMRAEKFKAIVEFDAAVRNLAEPQVKDLQVELPDYLVNAKNPKVVMEFERSFEAAKEYSLSIGAKAFIRRGAASFKNDKYSLEKYKKVLHDKEQTIIENVVRAVNREAGERGVYLKEEREFYKKWIDFMKVETVQGSDEHAALGTGVCYTINRRVEQTSQQNPDLSPQELGAGEILPSDRKGQATYKMSALLANTKLHDDCTELACTSYDMEKTDAFTAIMDSKIETLKKSSGWVGLAIYPARGGIGHVITMRLDEDRNKVWLFDSNYGLFEFNDSARTFEQAKTLCYACFNDMMTGFYQELPSVKIIQRVFASQV